MARIFRALKLPLSSTIYNPQSFNMFTPTLTFFTFCQLYQAIQFIWLLCRSFILGGQEARNSLSDVEAGLSLSPGLAQYTFEVPLQRFKSSTRSPNFRAPKAPAHYHPEPKAPALFVEFSPRKFSIVGPERIYHPFFPPISFSMPHSADESFASLELDLSSISAIAYEDESEDDGDEWENNQLALVELCPRAICFVEPEPIHESSSTQVLSPIIIPVVGESIDGLKLQLSGMFAVGMEYLDDEEEEEEEVLIANNQVNSFTPFCSPTAFG
ncbi:hypothetical protein C8J56DRAFT_1024489 [Mycena floridula]|nr:hypothetical protein C8J56DRAFT_1024489 [Mycena floridula]